MGLATLTAVTTISCFVVVVPGIFVYNLLTNNVLPVNRRFVYVRLSRVIYHTRHELHVGVY